MTVSLGDVLAAIDVVSQLVDECDSMDVEGALAMREAVGQLESEVKRADSMLTTQAKSLLEGNARQLGDRLYAVKPVGKWRFRHDDLEDVIRVRALGIDANGEITNSTAEAVQIAIELMHEAYVTPATEPKIGLINKLGFEQREDIARWQKTGTKIVVTDLSAPEGAE